MSFSKQLFDVFFSVAHWANLLSYCMPVLGLSIESFNEMQRLNKENLGHKTKEKRLMSEKAEFEQIFSAAAPLAGIDIDFNVIYANRAFCKLFYHNMESVKNKKCYEIMNFDICRTNDCLLKRTIALQDSVVIERSINDGKNIVQITACQFENSEHNEKGIVETFSDITNIKKVEQDLKDEQWIKQGLAEFSIKIHGEKDLSDLCRIVVTFLAEYMGAKIGACFLIQDNKKLKLFSSYAYTRRKHISDEFTLGQGIIGQAALEKQTITLTDIPKDYITISSSLGEISPGSIIIAPFDFNGQLIGVLEFGFLKEIGKMNMEFVKEASAFVAVAINSVRNQDKINEMLRQSQAQTEALRVREEELKQANDTLEEQTQKLEEQKISVNDKNNLLKEAHDVLEEKAKDLESISKYKSEFLANMSHELRTPLNSILLLSKHLAENKKDNLSKKEIEFADTVYNSGQDLLNLINDILDLSKVEAGKLTINAEDITLKSVGKNLKAKFLPVAKDKSISFKIKFAKNLPKSIYTDYQRLEQILKNFLSNAIKFTRKGSVTFDINHSDSNVVFSNKDIDPKECIAFSVIDTGVGIEPAKQKVIFEAFQQEDGSTSRKYGGTGLGLSISRSIANALGGEIQLFSEKGNGSKFVLYLPLSFIEPELTPSPEFISTVEPKQDERVSKPVENINRDYVEDDRKDIMPDSHSILIIEDDPASATILRDQAREKNYKVLVAESGETGLHLVDYYKPSGIILDLGLSDMPGFKILEEIKKDQKSSPPIIIHTATKLNSKEKAILNKYSESIVLKNIKSPDKFFDEITLFLHKVQADLPGNKQKILKKIHDKETIFKGKTILLVDDDMRNVYTLKNIFEDKGIKTIAAKNGKEALKRLADNSEIDLVLMDIMMPEMDGFEATGKIRKQRKFEDLPVITLTAKAMKGDRNKCIEAGASDYLSKPVDMDKLFSMLRVWLY